MTLNSGLYHISENVKRTVLCLRCFFVLDNARLRKAQTCLKVKLLFSTQMKMSSQLCSHNGALRTKTHETKSPLKAEQSGTRYATIQPNETIQPRLSTRAFHYPSATTSLGTQTTRRPKWTAESSLGSQQAAMSRSEILEAILFERTFDSERRGLEPSIHPPLSKQMKSTKKTNKQTNTVTADKTRAARVGGQPESFP